jgi:hypothetical protein
MNDTLQQQLVTLRHQLQTLQSLHRRTVAALDAFREHLITAGMTAPIIDIAALLAELDSIRARLSGEVHDGLL